MPAFGNYSIINRDVTEHYNTEKEKKLLTRESAAYEQLGRECLKYRIAVDLFIYCDFYTDVCTLM